MKKINLIHGFIAAAFVGMSVILIALGITLFGAKSTSEWSCHKADSAHFTEADSVRFEVEAKALDFGETERRKASAFQQKLKENFAAVDTFVYHKGAYLLIKNDRPFAGYTELLLQAEQVQVDVATLKRQFHRVESHVADGELWVRK